MNIYDKSRNSLTYKCKPNGVWKVVVSQTHKIVGACGWKELTSIASATFGAVVLNSGTSTVSILRQNKYNYDVYICDKVSVQRARR
jgi:hypothetical protein